LSAAEETRGKKSIALNAKAVNREGLMANLLIKDNLFMLNLLKSRES
jgi:hypothetical protein